MYTRELPSLIPNTIRGRILHCCGSRWKKPVLSPYAFEFTKAKLALCMLTRTCFSCCKTCTTGSWLSGSCYRCGKYTGFNLWLLRSHNKLKCQIVWGKGYTIISNLLQLSSMKSCGGCFQSQNKPMGRHLHGRHIILSLTKNEIPEQGCEVCGKMSSWSVSEQVTLLLL